MRSIAVFGLLVAGTLAYRFIVTPEWQQAFSAWSVSVAKPLLIPVVELIAAPAFVYLASLAIVVAAITACIAYWVRGIQPKLRQLRALRSELAELPIAHSSSAEQRFAALQDLGNLLRRRSLFLSAWAAFQGQSARYRRIPEEPFAHFATADRSTYDPQQRGLMHALPGFFTTTGLILTFVGLVVALYFAAKGFRSGNMEEARAAILQLLNASAFKFVTSVAALASALMISIFLRIATSILLRETSHTVSAIESYISEWRDIEGATGFARTTNADIADKLDVLIDGITRLNEELARVRTPSIMSREEVRQ